MVDALVARAKELFVAKFGNLDDAERIAAFAPGRVNLIGEHTDYNGGFVMPLALEMGTVVLGRGSLKRGGATAIGCHLASELMHEVVKFKADATLAPGDPSWANYVKGVVAEYMQDVPEGMEIVFEAAVVSDVPLGSGLSSSAAIEVSVATFLEGILGFAPAKEVKAHRCRMAEHRFVHIPCGIMDQFISAMGKKGATLLIDCNESRATPVMLDDPDVAIVVANSNVRHALATSEYGVRVRQCEAAVAAIKERHPSVGSLRDADMAWVEEIQEEVPDAVFRRARHVVSEDQRTLMAAGAMLARDYTRVGRCMAQSHESLRSDYEVSCKELDALVDIAMGVPGVYGSRMTGGGFGGCTVTLVRKSAVGALLKALEGDYPSREENTDGLLCTCFVTVAGPGAMLLQCPGKVSSDPAAAGAAEKAKIRGAGADSLSRIAFCVSVVGLLGLVLKGHSKPQR